MLITKSLQAALVWNLQNIMQVKRRYIQHWNQPEQEMDTCHHWYYWNPSRGNVRVGNQEVKWYNFITK